jgi:hypothetical protein
MCPHAGSSSLIKEKEAKEKRLQKEVVCSGKELRDGRTGETGTVL